MMKKGDYVNTPRFLRVRIEHVFSTEKKAREQGYTEPTHFIDDDYGILGKSLDLYHMKFAAYRKTPEEHPVKDAPCTEWAYFSPVPNTIYTYKDGSKYICLQSDGQGSALLQRIDETRWTFTAYGCQMYTNGMIEWQGSSNGFFADNG